MKVLFISVLVWISAVSTAQAQLFQLGTDIEGESADDASGISISLNSSGTRLAIGAHKNDGAGIDAGHVRIYEWDDSAWYQLGNDIDGAAAEDYFGVSTSFNAHGTRIAIGGYYNDQSGLNAGHVRVFEWANQSWTQMGSDMLGEASQDNFGRRVSMNTSGNRVVIGAWYNDDGGIDAGHARVFEWNGTTWNQLGGDLDGEGSYDRFGAAVSIDGSGNRIAIGGYSNDNNGTNAGHVKIFEWNGTNWTLMGSSLLGNSAGDTFGYSVGLNEIGNRVVVGGYGVNSNGNDAGQVRVFDWNGVNWSQVGLAIDGEAAEDNFGISVSINQFGNRIVASSPENDGSGAQAGSVRVFEWIDSAWSQIGSNLEGEAPYNFYGESVSMNATGEILACSSTRNSGNGTASGHVRAFQYLEQVNVVAGKVYIDYNADTVLNQNEPGFTQGNLLVAGSQIYDWSINDLGSFIVYCDTGLYASHFKPHNPDFYSMPLPPILSQFDSLDMVDTINFPVYLVPGHPDLQISLFPMGTARPGFDLSYRLIAKNVGTDTLDGSVVLYLDDSLTLNSTFPFYDSYQNDSLTWHFTDFAPLDEKVYDVFLEVWQSVAIGSDLSSSAVIRPVFGDEYPTDNYSSLRQTVTGSYDPNDKWVSHEYLTNMDVSDSNFLTYRIRFQNTGTDTAFAVVVKDTLDTNLDWSSIQMIHASHPWELTFRQDRFIEWNFPNILLPDSNIDEPSSHGYILYRIRPESTLQLGDEIHNSCSIYFDFNLPVKTNPVMTQVFYGAIASLSQTTMCVDDVIQLSVDHLGTMDGNNQTHLLLSDFNGSFSQPDTITTIHSDTSFGWQVPNVPGGSGYLIRAVTSAPYTNGDLGELNLSIQPLPTAQITPTLPIEFCDGESAMVNATTGNGYQYQWFNTGILLGGENNPDLVVNTPGKFGVVINNQCGTDTSDEVTVTVHSLPLVTYDTSYNLCHDQSSITLSSGQPLGGDYSGTGITNNSFSATTAGIGIHNISYTYIDTNGCSDTAWAQIEVEVCGGIARDLSTPLEMTVWPNPADDVVYLEWEGSEDAEVRVWSVTGELILNFEHRLTNVEFRTDGWASGIYIVKIQVQQKIFSTKFHIIK